MLRNILNWLFLIFLILFFNIYCFFLIIKKYLRKEYFMELRIDVFCLIINGKKYLIN